MAHCYESHCTLERLPPRRMRKSVLKLRKKQLRQLLLLLMRFRFLQSRVIEGEEEAAVDDDAVLDVI